MVEIIDFVVRSYTGFTLPLIFKNVTNFFSSLIHSCTLKLVNRYCKVSTNSIKRPVSFRTFFYKGKVVFFDIFYFPIMKIIFVLNGTNDVDIYNDIQYI